MQKSVILVTLLSLICCECRGIGKILDFFNIGKVERYLNIGKLERYLKVGDPDMRRNVTELITSKGYPAEEHTVQTADGYLLGVQRIPHDKDGRLKGVKKPVVILQHGLLSASSDWVFNFPDQSLGFLLADAGYDVWLGNTRGNTYSRRHVEYSPSQHEFWNYSFDEMAKYDLPAIIDYALNATGEEEVYYIGHSQGTTSAFALLSENPEYNKKIKLFIALAPVTTVGYITNAIKYLAPFTTEINFFTSLVGMDEFLPNDLVMKLLSEFVCDTAERFICENIMFLSFGYDKYELNATRIGVYSAHTPAGTSTKSIVHYGQMVNSGRFTKYDYGRKGNMERYNQTTPPEYQPSRITTPVALIWSLNDPLADPVDVDALKKKLKSLVSSYCVPFEYFNHGDFVMAIHANRLVYDKVFELLKQH